MSQPQQPQQPFQISAKYLIAVGLIYTFTSCAWLFLGKVTENRTHEKDDSLRSEVGRLWGGTHNHIAPSVTLPAEPVPPPATPAPAPAAAQAGPVQPVAPPPPDPCRVQVNLEPSRTRAAVDLRLEHRRKGLLWYSTYTVLFDGSYQFKNDGECAREARLAVLFPATGVSYDEFQVQLDGQELPVQIERSSGSASGAAARIALPPGQHKLVRVRYVSRGMDLWRYSFGAQAARARDFELKVRTDFAKVDFPTGSLSPTQKQAQGTGWELTWHFGNLLSDAGVSVSLPQKINPGPLATEISRFAPVSLAFFFFLMLLLSVIKQVRLHPVHYAMLAAAFFSFHLLLVYSVDLLPLGVAFGLASGVSVLLVVSYLRLAVGPRFALLWAGGGQLVYLVLFSLAFFLEGYTGITITVFSILTLFVVMQLTGRVDWASKFARGPLPPSLRNAAPPAGAAAPEGPRVFSRVG
jgi:hypothetical protein